MSICWHLCICMCAHVFKGLYASLLAFVCALAGDCGWEGLVDVLPLPCSLWPGHMGAQMASLWFGDSLLMLGTTDPQASPTACRAVAGS